MPPKENITSAIDTHTPLKPKGIKPPSFIQLEIPAAGVPGRPKNTRHSPTRMNTTTAITLMLESQNSIVPKLFTLTTLIATTIAPRMATPAHCGKPGAQNCRYRLHAYSSAAVTPTVTIQ